MAGPNKVTGQPDVNIPDEQEFGYERCGPQGDRIMSQLHGDMTEASRSGQLFFAANQAAVTTTVALALTYTGLCIYNPVGNDKDLLIRHVSWQFTVAPAGITEVGLMVGYIAAAGGPGITLTTEMAMGAPLGGLASLYIGTQFRNPSARVSENCTFIAPGPFVCAHFGGSFTAAALGGNNGIFQELGGGLRLAPGSYCAIYTLTVTVGMGHIWWEEVPRKTGAGT